MCLVRISVAVSIKLISLDVDEIGVQACSACSGLMELHQPDAVFPERMLWTCPYCATWFLMDIDPNGSEAVLVCLPDHGQFRAAIPDDD